MLLHKSPPEKVLKRGGAIANRHTIYDAISINLFQSFAYHYSSSSSF